MMKKSLIALAIAAAAPAAFAATANVDVYGQVRIAYEAGDTNNGVVTSKASRIGVKGSEDLGGGLTALYQAEFAISPLSTTSTDGVVAGTLGNALSNRDTFVGVKGGFGTVILGNHRSPESLSMGANQLEDTLGDKNQILGEEAGFKDRVVAYVSPNVNGFHAAVAAVTVTGTASDTIAGTSYALVYANGPLSAALGGTNYDAAGSADSQSLTLGYKVDDLALRATTQTSKKASGGDNTDFDANYVDATYKMGAMDLTAAYGKRDLTGTGNDITATTLGARYNLSKRTNVQLIWNKKETAGSADVTNTALQVNHSF